MKKIILITSDFPYSRGEQFLETEIKYYRYENVKVIILPIKKNSKKRVIPENIVVDDYIADYIAENRRMNRIIRIYYFFKFLKDRIFYKELCSEKWVPLKKLKIFFTSIYSYGMHKKIFNSYFSKMDDLDKTLVYTYWNNEVTYALQSLKQKYGYKLISRIHRGDIYKEIKTYNYMPLKKHFTTNIEKIFTITESANFYLKNTYGFSEDILQLSRLGVEDKGIITKCSKENNLYLVSCSFLKKVKQIHKIIESLELISLKRKDVFFYWTHIGSGKLYNELVNYAKKKLDNIKNVSYNFVGEYENYKIYEFYKNNPVDLFINVSESEGVPVSIMEAMSCHIPVIAPDVGGIKDMVIDGYNGVLLKSNFEIKDIISALNNIEFFKNKGIRDNSYKIFLDKYNAKKNYPKFVKDLIKIVKNDTMI